MQIFIHSVPHNGEIIKLNDFAKKLGDNSQVNRRVHIDMTGVSLIVTLTSRTRHGINIDDEINILANELLDAGIEYFVIKEENYVHEYRHG